MGNQTQTSNLAAARRFALVAAPRKSQRVPRRLRLTGIWLVALMAAGCESPSWKRSLSEPLGAQEAADAGPRTEEEHRREYIESHNRRSLRWLLGHRVKPGMSYTEVCHVLGEDGELEQQARWLKTRGPNIRIDDEIYAFGPDSEGHNLYLTFREGQLINFDPEEFQ